MNVQLIVKALALISSVVAESKPGCKSGSYEISSKRIAKARAYKGNYQDIDFIADGQFDVMDNKILLKMSEPNQGVSLYTTRYINYGKISASMKIPKGAGLVSSFITMSDDKDEIDYEWLGKDVKAASTNYFIKGEKVYTNSKVVSQPDASKEWTRFTIDWSKDRIIWLINDKPIHQYDAQPGKFPNTPSKVGFGLWDGGSGAQGTRDWAGGYINWEAEDMKTKGYFALEIKDIEFTCYGESSPDATPNTDKVQTLNDNSIPGEVPHSPNGKSPQALKDSDTSSSTTLHKLISLSSILGLSISLLISQL